jgi:hypothetical protein
METCDWASSMARRDSQSATSSKLPSPMAGISCVTAYWVARMRKYRTTWIALLTLAVSIGFVTPSHATTGIVRVTVAKSGFVVSAGGGKGVLSFRHHDYPFTVQGISLGLTAGASIKQLVGWASHLNELSDFPGTYSVVGARDARGVKFKNAKGVIITFVDPRGSLEVSDFTRVLITLDQSRSAAN